MKDDEFWRATFVELTQVAGAVDRMLMQCQDRVLATKLATIRSAVSATTEDLAERCEMVQRTPEQLVYYRQFPWDRV
jgi:hypothetical protein